MRTHRPLFFTAATAALLLGASALAQPAAQPTRPLPPPMSTPADMPRNAPGDARQVASGRIQQWLVNPNGEVDGLLLADGTQVAFPPHLSASVLQALKVGDTVQVSGWRAENAAAQPVVRAASLANGAGKRVDAQPPSATDLPRPPGSLRAPRDGREPGALTAMSASGKVARVLYTGRGDANGLLLDNGGIVRFAPHVGAAMAARLQPGSTVYARGWGSRVAQGSAFEATAIGASADSMQELFAGPGAEPPPPRAPRASRALRALGPRGPRAPGPDVAPPPPPPGVGQPAPPAPV